MKVFSNGHPLESEKKATFRLVPLLAMSHYNITSRAGVANGRADAAGRLASYLKDRLSPSAKHGKRRTALVRVSSP